MNYDETKADVVASAVEEFRTFHPMRDYTVIHDSFMMRDFLLHDDEFDRRFSELISSSRRFPLYIIEQEMRDLAITILEDKYLV